MNSNSGRAPVLVTHQTLLSITAIALTILAVTAAAASAASGTRDRATTRAFITSAARTTGS
jgi:hypothetical protein